MVYKFVQAKQMSWHSLSANSVLLKYLKIEHKPLLCGVIQATT